MINEETERMKLKKRWFQLTWKTNMHIRLHAVLNIIPAVTTVAYQLSCKVQYFLLILLSIKHKIHEA